MEATVRSLAPEYPAVELRFFGVNTREQIEHTLADALALASESDTWLLLADCTDLRRPPTIPDLKDLIDALAAAGVTDQFREALVRPQDVTVAVGIWRTAGTNRGLAIDMFRDRDEALAWLLGTMQG